MHLLWPQAVFLCFLSTSLAVLVNVTIDDTLGDSENGRLITYLPEGAWNLGPTCTSCSATPKLDRSGIHNGTWHDGEANQSPHDEPNEVEQPLLAIVPFYGSAIYVYCVVANTRSSPDGNTDMTFLIDSQWAGEFIRQPTGDDTFDYNVLVFTNQSLPHTNHTLTIQNGHVGGYKSLVLFDYIVYTYENGLSALPTDSIHPRPQSTSVSLSTPSSSQPSNSDPPPVDSSGKIVGGVLGSLAVVLLGLVAILWRRQRDSKESPGPSTPPRPLPKRPSLIPAERIQRWWRKPASETPSRFSFNPSLLVEPMVDRHQTMFSRSYPPPVRTVLPIQPLPQRPDSTQPLQPNREATPTPSMQSLDPRNEERQPISILEWQRRTQLEADATPPRFDVTDRDLSSYYEFSSDGPEPPPPAHARPRSTPRHFTVVNN
ncbi:hypothetical protein LshimejAT787_0308840 [Lyophyllum shimeji]|uniref:Uncharacterized protein n=1 Tax=Lyophyllum shimeji TaxID=47721 RepID=A0A9P3UMR8_LYOSH|nr:hypothetical protein LshimejAT787_0308840 [Lyophyllum shimeji]